MSGETLSDETIVVGVNEEIRVTGTDTSQQVIAVVDTGANRSCIDTALAETVGAVSTDENKNFRSSHDESENRPIKTITIEIADRTHHVPVSVTDRSGLSTDIRIGRDVLIDGYAVKVGQQD